MKSDEEDLYFCEIKSNKYNNLKLLIYYYS